MDTAWVRPARILSATAIALAAAFSAPGCSSITGLLDRPAAPPPPASSAPEAAPGVVATDPASRASARLAGPSTVQNGTMDGGVGALRAYVAKLQHGAVQMLAVGELGGPPQGDPVSHVKEIAAAKKGTVTKNQPVTVNGHPGTDFRMSLVVGGKKGFMLGRMVYTANGLVQVITTGPQTDEATDAPLHDQAAASLRVP